MKTITHSEFVAALRNHNGTAILTIVAETEPKIKKTGCPFGTVTRRVYRKMMPGGSYENAVKKQGGAETFEAAPLPWGEWLVPGKVLTHKGKFYLRSNFRNDDTQPFESEFFADGQLVPKKWVEPFLMGSAPSKRQSEAGVSEEDHVQVRAYAFDNILEVAFNGERCQLVPDKGAETVAVKTAQSFNQSKKQNQNKVSERQKEIESIVATGLQRTVNGIIASQLARQ